MSEADKAVFNQLADAIETKDRENAALREALRSVRKNLPEGAQTAFAIIDTALNGNGAETKWSLNPRSLDQTGPDVMSRRLSDGTIVQQTVAALNGSGGGRERR